jgi:lipopolysaccharide/colanic/teichoic acid biosynthesis glycosyltransferase
MAMSLPQRERDYELAQDASTPSPAEPVRPEGVENLLHVATGEATARPVSFFKRAVDVAVAAIFLLLLSPIIGILALVIVLDSRGSPIFAQRRVGRGGREFRFFKLRTMVQDAEARLSEVAALNEAQPPLFKMRNDPRVTRVGSFLRRSSLDELPQLWNVLRGDMSLVGPRPPLPSEVATYTPEQARRLSVVPGMTGLWQVSGRSDIDFDDAITLDLTYIDTWSLALDFRLLLQTLLVVVRPRGAY